MNTSNYTAVIADDLTGAGDTSLQFFIQGASVQAAFGENPVIDEELHTQVFALSTETRNSGAQKAEEKIINICRNILQQYNFEYIYKKMDSVLRGNFAVEIMTMVNELKYDAAVIFPAFPAEGRTTIGGFQLLNGIPVQKTEFSRDPKFPVTESNILNVFKNQLSLHKDETALIPLDIVMKGAGAVLLKLNELISQGKKYIAADAVSYSDLEQTALAVSKCAYKILPAGSAGAAQALSALWHPAAFNEKSNENQYAANLPKLPLLIISGSASAANAGQIKTLKECGRFNDIKFIPINMENIFSNDTESTALKILECLERGYSAVVHTAELTSGSDFFENWLQEKEMTRETFTAKICPYLASAAQKALSRRSAVLIVSGGETSCSCLQALSIRNIKILDSAALSVPFAQAGNGQYIVTKSGSFGSPDIFIQIVNYFKRKS